MKRKTIYVYAGWREVGDPTLMGFLHSEKVKGREVFSFEYDGGWLENPQATLLDPDLSLVSWPQFMPDDNRELFGMFTDSCPDRWGTLLMKRHEFALARAEGRPENELTTSDFLLGVYDYHRMGGLRFKLDPDGSFLNGDTNMEAPPLSSLRELEAITKMVEEDAVHMPEYLNWVLQLIAPGGSLGGARPKAGVIDPTGQLWIAKFPAINDSSDVGAWEMVIHRLAESLGIPVPGAQILQLNSKYHTYLSRRFDRDGEDRIHFTSAMTMLGKSDHHDDTSYEDIAKWISLNCVNVEQNLRDLFTRMVFNICVGNVDEHLRNHGFLLGKKGWELSPVYDVNPAPEGSHLRLNIRGYGNELDLDLCLESAESYRLDQNTAKEIIDSVMTTTRKYGDVARDIGIPRAEIVRMDKAFNKFKMK